MNLGGIYFSWFYTIHGRYTVYEVIDETSDVEVIEKCVGYPIYNRNKTSILQTFSTL